MFLMKSLLRLTPVAFGVSVIYGTVLMVGICFAAIAGSPLDQLASVALTARNTLLASAALPLAAYLVFLLGNLVVSLWRSVLSLPVKLDQLAGNRENEPKDDEPQTAPTTRPVTGPGRTG